MLFNSLEYLVFLPLVVLLYYLTPSRYKWLLLLLFSVVFISYTNLRFIYIVLALILVNYTSCLYLDSIQSQKKKRVVYITTLIANIAVLVFFKYFNFLNENLTAVLSLAKIENPVPAMSLLLPLGISFYTFQSIGYTYEVYTGKQKAEKHFGIFAAYILFFPKFIAGPIERSYNFLPQFHSKFTFDYTSILVGMRLILWGLFKKIVIGDRLSIFVVYGFNNIEGQNDLSLLFLIFLQAFQLYADFSGYTDIALGSAKILGFDLTDNFRKPFLATSVSEYWRRWHISLASWVNDYIYKPISLSIAINRRWGQWGIIYALTVTFLIFGIWHGAEWTFFVFGLVQSLALAWEVLSRKIRKKVSQKIDKSVYRILSIFITFMFVCYSSIFFRAGSLQDAFHIIIHSFSGIPDLISMQSIKASLKGIGMDSWDVLVSFSGIMIIIVTHLSKYHGINDALASRSIILRWFIYMVLILTIIFVGTFKSTEFTYFQF